jgi:hypothetical protein
MIVKSKQSKGTPGCMNWRNKYLHNIEGNEVEIVGHNNSMMRISLNNRLYEVTIKPAFKSGHELIQLSKN